MRENPERLAWTILLLSFATFCFLAVSIPLGIRWYVINATDAHATAVTSLRGTVIVEEDQPKRAAPVTEGNTVEVDEGASVDTGETSQATLTFFEDSTVTLYNNTRVVLDRVRSPRFSLSPKPPTIILQILKGRIRLAPSVHSPLHFEVRSPQATTWVEQGSYALEVSEDMTQITARAGQARVEAAGGMVTLKEGERATVENGRLPSAPLSAEQNLVVNGNFTEPLSGTWQIYTFTPDQAVIPEGKRIIFDDHHVMQFKSSGRDNIHSEVGIRQDINKDVRDFHSLRAHLNVWLVSQSLPGGGTLGTEYPVMIHISYKDPYGNDRDWYHGFYYEPTLPNWLLPNGEHIARSVWYPYESENLLISLGDVKPIYINYIRIYASGWLYESMVTEVALLAQE
jgi:hypothetical protein